jgi:hypothetical protein
MLNYQRVMTLDDLEFEFHYFGDPHFLVGSLQECDASHARKEASREMVGALRILQ